MTNKDRQRINELKKLIAFYDEQYYEKGISDISDAEYDRLYDEYLGLESQYPEIKTAPDAPTRRIGAGDKAGSSSLPKITHKSPLLSINNKSRELEDLRDFYESLGGDGTEVIIEPKLDGITCNVNYENGVFLNAATRGNGYIGDLITDNFKETETKYPQILSKSVDLELRGEAIIPYDFFKQNLSTAYSNPRNAVAGIMRNIDSKEVKDKGVHVMFYDVGKVKDFPLKDRDSDNVGYVKLIGFESVPVVVVDNWKDLKNTVKTHLNNMIKNIDGFNVLVADGYPQAVCDGLVIKANRKVLRENLGMTEKGPRWAFAHKFKPLQSLTRIDHIEWQVGKTGVITPVGVFDEIMLGGVKITKATLNNAMYMLDLPVLDSQEKIHIFPYDTCFEMPQEHGIRMDDTIIVERSNDVIPRIVAIQHRAKEKEQDENRLNTFKVPQFCPVCGAPTEYIGPQIYCTGQDCSAQMLGKLEHFVSRDAMNIVGLGESALEDFMEQGWLTDFVSIYKELPNRKMEIMNLERYGKKKTENLIKSIEKSRNIPLYRFIYALSIPGVGLKTAKDLAKTYQSITRFMDGNYEELLLVDGVSNVSATAIDSWKTNDNHRNMVKELLQYVLVEDDVGTKSDAFKGKTFVITGTLTNPRKYYQELIESHGGKVSGSVSKKTYAVLIGNDAGSKEKKARDLVNGGSEILLLDNENSIEEFFKNVEENKE